MRWFLALLFLTMGVASCVGAPSQTPSVQFKIETVASNLEVPWGIAFLPDGRKLVTERPGRLRLIEKGKLLPEALQGPTDVVSRGEGGLMDVILHPDFSRNGFFYVYYTHAAGDGIGIRVARYRLDGRALRDRKVIVSIPGGGVHVSGRMGFGPDRKLYVTTGDTGRRDLAQDLGSLAGKTLRLNDDGSIPSDNPFRTRRGARPEIWSYGHRNAQGIDWQPGTHTMFQTEHGPTGFDAPGGGDEVNIVKRGANYGWPEIHHERTRPGMVDPLLEYTPAVAPASGRFYRGSLFPELKGNLLFGCLRGECLIRVVLDGNRVVRQERLLEDRFGRLRAVAEGPDGALYVTTSNRDGRGTPAAGDDRILRLVPGP